VDQYSQAVIWLKQTFGFKVVLSFHGSDIHQLDMKELHYKRCIRAIVNNASNIIFRSKKLTEIASTVLGYHSDIHVIPSFVNHDLIDSIQPKKYTENYFFSCGRLVNIKGIDRLIYFYTHIPNSPILIIAGDGPKRRDLEEMCNTFNIRKKVLFLGALKNEEIISWLKGSLLYLHTSYNDGTPMTILEAMACGTPTVAIPVGGISELLENNQTGILAKPHEFASAVSHILTNGQLYKDISKLARAKSRSFSSQKVALYY